MNYLDYYELAQEPFSNAPVSRFYFNSPQHSQALVRLTHLCSQMKGLGILVGDIGAGKTTLARRLLDSLPENEYEAALLVIIHSGVTASWLLKRIALQLGVDAPSEDKLTLLGQLYQRLVRIYESGKKAVVLIDEAQMLATRELMEEFRGLLNLEVPERKLLSFVFFGLPEIERNLKLDPPLAQRVALRYRLEPLAEESTEAYIKHRLRLAGSARMPFTAEAIEAIHAHSGERAWAVARAQLPGLLGGPVQIGRCELNPLGFGVSLHDVRVQGPLSGPPVLEADQLDASFGGFDLLQGSVQLGRVLVKRPR